MNRVPYGQDLSPSSNRSSIARPASMTALGRPFLLLALVAFLSVTGYSLSALRGPSSVVQPAIVPASGQQGSQIVEREFSFEDRSVRLSVPIDRAVYAGSVSAQKSVIFYGDAPTDWVSGYYRAFIDEEHQAPFYSAMLEALHEVRRREGLDSARYVELVTSMAQALEYRTDPVDLAPKFPIETVGDGYGDCDDKALLAAALLSRDGYDVAILVFSPEKHVALGIRAPGLDYKGTGYAYVELTQPSLVGVPAAELAGGLKLTSQPLVVRIGQGTGDFTAGAQVGYIQQRLEALRTAQKRLEGEIQKGKADVSAEQESLEAQKEALEKLTDPQSSVTAITRYNELARVFNERVARLGRLIAEYNALVDAERYVAEHQFARPQVYQRLRSLQLR